MSAPTFAPTHTPILEKVSPLHKSHWYTSTAFIIPTTLFGTLLLVGALFNFWLIRRRQRRMKEKDGKTPVKGYNDHENDVENNIMTSDNFKETDSLLGTNSHSKANKFSPVRNSINARSEVDDAQTSDHWTSKIGKKLNFEDSKYDNDNNNNNNNNNSRNNDGMSVSSASSMLTTATGVQSPSIQEVTSDVLSIEDSKFDQFDMQDGHIDERNCLDNFETIMAKGVILALHTVKGPKTVLFSMVNGEVRWQAAKLAQKRYKLSLKDISSVEKGKSTTNFERSVTTHEDLCFSLLTAKTTLDLEAVNRVDRDCLVLGFGQHLARAHKGNGQSADDVLDNL